MYHKVVSIIKFLYLEVLIAVYFHFSAKFSCFFLTYAFPGKCDDAAIGRGISIEAVMDDGDDLISHICDPLEPGREQPYLFHFPSNPKKNVPGGNVSSLAVFDKVKAISSLLVRLCAHIFIL